MQTFTGQRTITTVKRQVYTGAKSTYTTVASTLTGYLRPLSEEQSAFNNIQWGKGFQLITEVGVNIEDGDRITIESVDYTVRGKAVHDRGYATQYTKYLLVKPETV